VRTELRTTGGAMRYPLSFGLFNRIDRISSGLTGWIDSWVFDCDLPSS
jgi:hypothetical protein